MMLMQINDIQNLNLYEWGGGGSLRLPIRHTCIHNWLYYSNLGMYNHYVKEVSFSHQTMFERWLKWDQTLTSR